MIKITSVPDSYKTSIRKRSVWAFWSVHNWESLWSWEPVVSVVVAKSLPYKPGWIKSELSLVVRTPNASHALLVNRTNKSFDSYWFLANNHNFSHKLALKIIWITIKLIKPVLLTFRWKFTNVMRNNKRNKIEQSGENTEYD